MKPPGRLLQGNLLKIIEYYGLVSDDNASIPEAEFKKVDQSEPKQIAAPPIASTEENANDLAAQNSDEPVERKKE